METFKVKYNGDNVELFVRAPSKKDKRESERVRMTTVAKMLKNGGDEALSRNKLDEYLREHGIWTDKDDARLGELLLEIQQLSEKLQKGGMKLEEGRKIAAIDISERRDQTLQLIAKKQEFDNITIEGRSERKQIEYLAFLCTTNTENNERFWTTFEDFQEDEGEDVYDQALERAYRHINGTDDDEFILNLPENKWLHEYGFLDDKLNFVDRKTGKPMNASGEIIEKENKEPKQKPFFDENGQPVKSVKKNK